MAHINDEQVRKVAEFVKTLEDNGLEHNFYGFLDMYPPLNHPEAINFFFFVCLHQYGFWYGDKSGYLKPLIGRINGKDCKGSDLLWKATMRALNNNETVFRPEHLAAIEPTELFFNIFSDDKGPIPFPDLKERFKITRQYGRWFQKQNLTPSMIVSKANSAEKQLKCFREQLRLVDGYNEDFLEKKNLLLAMVLGSRPERFLDVGDFRNWQPITDYHLMRVALRLGLVDLDKDEIEENRSRSWVNSKTEKQIRAEIHKAIQKVINQSWHSMAFIDEKMWNARRYCPEMSKPDCAKCIFTEVCKKRIELFQPVFRTTAY